MKNLIKNVNDKFINNNYYFEGWIRNVRSSSNILGFCNINDGSNVNGLQVIVYTDIIDKEIFDKFFQDIRIGCYVKLFGKLVESPMSGQKYELQLISYELIGDVYENYPLTKNKMNLETLRNFYHLRGRTNSFGSIYRIRSKLIKFIHDFFQDKDFLNLDPNIITTNECEGGAGVFQITEKDISCVTDLPIKNLDIISKLDKKIYYNWEKDHFCKPTYLTVSSQLQLEALACSLGNVYTMNKSFRSEHSSTIKHVSEFTHLEIEMIGNTLDDLMDIGEEFIKYCINRLFNELNEDIENLNKFVSKGIIEKLKTLKDTKFIKIKYHDIINEINKDIDDKLIKLNKLNYLDDLGSEYENYITTKYNTGVFITHWPLEIKSFYMKQCEDGTCESFDLLIPYGIGELIGSSQREDNYDKLLNVMENKQMKIDDLSFYLDLRKYGSCPHGGFGLGFDRLLMLITGMQNIRDVIPFPVFYKNCKY